MQKFFDQAISGNWSYNPLQFENNEVPLSVMAQDMLNTYKYGWKTSYYQNTYDFKGEEEEVQPAGIGATQEDEGEDVILEPENPNLLNGVNGATKISTTADEDGECEACTI